MDQCPVGSDSPCVRPERCLDELAGLDIAQPVLDKLLFGNASRLLGLR